MCVVNIKSCGSYFLGLEWEVLSFADIASNKIIVSITY